MSDKEKELGREASFLETEAEKLSAELSVEEKKMLIRKARQTYGRDWKKILFGAAKSVRPKMDVIHDLYGMGVGDEGDLRGKR